MICLLAAFVLMPVMITGESLWLDEGDTAVYAMQPDFPSWLHHLTSDMNADCQMPLTMLTSWVVGISWGTGEWLLRAQNFIFGGIALVAMYAMGRRAGLPWLPLLLAIQPFFWFYMDEARPYCAQIAGGSLLLWVLTKGCHELADGNSWLTVFSLVALLAFTTSMLTAVSIAVVFACLLGVAGWPKPEEIKKPAVLLIFLWLLAAMLAGYYLWTVNRGATGSRIWGVDWKSLGFTCYEFIGVTGLGLSLEELRNSARNSITWENLKGFVLPVVFSANFVVLFSIYGWGWFRKRTPAPKLFTACAIALVSIILGFATLSFLIHKPLWARHLSPALPMLVFMEGVIIATVWNSQQIIPRIFAVSFLMFLALSSLNIRFHPRFAKDDYRTAAQIVKDSIANGQRVWWSAADYTGLYYGLSVDCNLQDSSCPVVLPHHKSTALLEQLPAPDVIIITRPEVCDPAHFVQNYLATKGYNELKEPAGFRIFKSPAP